MRQEIESLPLEFDHDIDDNDNENDDHDNNEVQTWDKFKSTVPYWRTLIEMHLPLTVASCKYTRMTGTYLYPVEAPPDFPSNRPRKSENSSAQTDLKYHFVTQNACHSCELCCYTVEQKSTQITISFMDASRKISINYPCLPHYEQIFKDHNVPLDLVYIMTPSYGRVGNARLNYNHLFLDENESLVPFIHCVFVRKSEYESYVLQWGNYVAVIEVPDEMTDVVENIDVGGIGYTRRFIQRFCFDYDIKGFYMVDDTLVYLKQLLSTEESQPINMLHLHKQFQQIGSTNHNVPSNMTDFDRHDRIQDPNVIAAYSGPLDEYAFIGARKNRGIQTKIKTFHAKRHVSSFFWINNDILVKKEILFEPWKVWEDLQISNEADAKGLNVVKLNAIEFTKIHGRDSSLLYEWKDDDFGKDFVAAMHVMNQKIEQILMRFLKTVRIRDIHGSLGPEKQQLDVTIKHLKTVDKGGCTLILGENFEIATKLPSENLLFVLKLSRDFYYQSKSLDDLQNQIASKMGCAIQLQSVFSTHKPIVTDDFLVIQTLKLPPSVMPSATKIEGETETLKNPFEELFKILHRMESKLDNVVSEMTDLKSKVDNIESMQEQFQLRFTNTEEELASNISEGREQAIEGENLQEENNGSTSHSASNVGFIHESLVDREAEIDQTDQREKLASEDQETQENHEKDSDLEGIVEISDSSDDARETDEDEDSTNLSIPEVESIQKSETTTHNNRNDDDLMVLDETFSEGSSSEESVISPPNSVQQRSESEEYSESSESSEESDAESIDRRQSLRSQSSVSPPRKRSRISPDTSSKLKHFASILTFDFKLKKLILYFPGCSPVF